MSDRPSSIAEARGWSDMDHLVNIATEMKRAQQAIDRALSAVEEAGLAGSEPLDQLERASALVGQAVVAIEPAFKLEMVVPVGSVGIGAG